MDMPNKGIIKWNGNEYRVHRAWSANPVVFVRYTTHGRNIERRLDRSSATALKAVIRFRNKVSKELALKAEA